MYQEKTLTCQDCGNQFIFTEGEQEFFASKGFENEPRRCPECRSARKNQGGGRGGRGGDYRQQREMYSVTCSRCGKEAQVPFQPTGDKPVYCSECFRSERPSRY